MVLNVRDVPREIVARMKARATLLECSLKDCVIAACKEWADKHDEFDQKSAKRRFQQAMGDNTSETKGFADKITERELIPIDEA